MKPISSLGWVDLLAKPITLTGPLMGFAALNRSYVRCPCPQLAKADLKVAE
jgi:hypothetical protein